MQGKAKLSASLTNNVSVLKQDNIVRSKVN
jgi:hypothetical protein